MVAGSPARSPVSMISEMGVRSMVGTGGDSFGGEDLGMLLREQRKQEAIERERELNICRSGSAPPSVEGSLAAVGGLFTGPSPDFPGAKSRSGLLSEEELRSDPAYLSYYYSNVNLNPRLPPPLLSKEDWRFAQRLQAGSSGLGGIGDRRKTSRDEQAGGRSLFSMQPGFNYPKEEQEMEPRNELRSQEWLDKGDDGLIGLPGLSLGRQKSFAEIIQNGFGHTASTLGHSSFPRSQNGVDNSIESLGSPEAQFSLPREVESADDLSHAGNLRNVPSVQNVGVSTAQTFASVLGSSLARGNTPDAHLEGRARTPCLPPVGVKLGGTGRKTDNGSYSFTDASSGIVGSDDLVDALAGLDLSSLREADFHSGPSLKASSVPGVNCPGDSPSNFANFDSSNRAFTGYRSSGYSMNPSLSSIMSNHIGSGNLPPLYESAVASAISSPKMDARALGEGYLAGPNLTGAIDLQNLNRIGNHAAAAASLQMPLVDPLYVPYLRASENGYAANSFTDLLEIQKSYLGSLLHPQKQHGMGFLGKSAGLGNGYHGNPAYGLGMSFPGSPLASPVNPGSPIGPSSPLHRGIAYGMRNIGGGSWYFDSSGTLVDGLASSLLEEFKNNKAKCFELSDIAGHVVEFSADQFGSRFIQQKLETATTEDKDMVFNEIMPKALSLMTDVFGNYVVQKFLEHGSAAQIRELADQLTGHILTLSLQMYGCRVIQKTIEVVEFDQQTKMVIELDGHVMRCVRDQNGNHVIQKCIECVPQDAIQFIISTFYDQVVTLSTHPYGCRVIQRVLEHCHDPKTQQIVMDEIMHCVCMLAQDQYGNYVVQHVLEHGKLHERSAIIKKLIGQIVHMSQQKFASNVVEKCLTFGSPEERQLLVNEMLGSTEENEPLQSMMKDQFGNYVVQKVLETCDDPQRELILSRIKVHLTALKKYTYGKHIVARVEKLVAAGERRIGIQSSYTS